MSDNIDITLLVTVGEMTFYVDTTIRREKWEEMIPDFIGDIMITISNLDYDSVQSAHEDYGHSTSYMGLDGYWRESETGEQNFAAFFLQQSQCTMTHILDSCDALEQAFEDIKKCVHEYAPDSDEYRLLEQVEDVSLAMYGLEEEETDGDWDENFPPGKVVFVDNDTYPPVLLEEIYVKLVEL